MSDQLANGANDGTIEGAVQAMAGLNFDAPADQDNLISFEQARDGVRPQTPQQQPQRRENQPRQPNGQYDTWAQQQAPNGQPQQQAQPLQQQAAAQEDATSAEEQFFEIDADTEGGEKQRIPAADVWQGYQEREQLRNELAEMRKQVTPPAEYDRQIAETVTARTQLMRQMQTYAAMLKPQMPNAELLNQASPNYNPDQYYRQYTLAQQMEQQLAHVRGEYEQLEAENSRQQEALMQARISRERSRLAEIWPEVTRDAAKAQKVREVAARVYGIDEKTFRETVDARFYHILRDAIRLQDMLAAQKTAAKVVTSKPRLTRAAARAPDTAKQMQFSTNMQRLSRTGSLDDAAEALGGLL